MVHGLFIYWTRSYLIFSNMKALYCYEDLSRVSQNFSHCKGREKRALILGPEALGSDPGPTTTRIHEGILFSGWPTVFLPSVLRAPKLWPCLCYVALTLLSLL